MPLRADRQMPTYLPRAQLKNLREDLCQATRLPQKESNLCPMLVAPVAMCIHVAETLATALMRTHRTCVSMARKEIITINMQYGMQLQGKKKKRVGKGAGH